ncbi:hypothetical protein A0H81_11553 [Grifola frondosa]|uniref:Uncharacterized protein n=1 Tax=Grifola frondosa TaxID=5627 RepID=A0A1C7LV96_GRIFR|nr:hypothetical protein A0H81_11553 [Grifola frondosa]
MISRGEVHDALPSNPPADVIIDKWLEKLNSIDDPCVEIVEQSGVLFDFWLFGSQGSIENIWDSFSSSPIMTHFGWSPLVELAFDTNRDLIHPTPVWEPFLSTQPFRSNIERYTMLHGLLVLHVRRGDYQDHCDHLAKWSSSYMSFNTFPDIPDRFSPPEGGGWGENTPENMDIYLSHCFPSIEQIVAKVESVRTTDAAAGLQNIYIMTNGAVPWVQELKDALKKSGHFTSVTSSRDMVLNWEQKYVAQAVDMLIGQRAQAFIGNGFSSMTSNINMLRMANKFRRDSIHFW